MSLWLFAAAWLGFGSSEPPVTTAELMATIAQMRAVLEELIPTPVTPAEATGAWGAALDASLASEPTNSNVSCPPWNFTNQHATLDMEVVENGAARASLGWWHAGRATWKINVYSGLVDLTTGRFDFLLKPTVETPWGWGSLEGFIKRSGAKLKIQFTQRQLNTDEKFAPLVKKGELLKKSDAPERILTPWADLADDTAPQYQPTPVLL